MDFIELKAQLGIFLGLGQKELPDSTRGLILNLVQRRFCRLHESRFGENSDSMQTRHSIRDYALPEGWSKPRSFWYPDQYNQDNITWIDYVTKDEFDATYPASGLFGSTFTAPMGAGAFGETNLGEPLIYTVWAGYIMLGPVPNRVFTIFRNWWRIPEDLTDAKPTNEFTKQAWEYLLFKGLVTASEFGFEDDRVPIWAAEADQIEKDLIIEDARSRTTAHAAISEMPG